MRLDTQMFLFYWNILFFFNFLITKVRNNVLVHCLFVSSYMLTSPPGFKV